MKNKVFIFDVDDVLIDTKHHRLEQYRKIIVDGKILTKENFKQTIEPYILSSEYAGAKKLYRKFGLSKEVSKQYINGVQVAPMFYRLVDGAHALLRYISYNFPCSLLYFISHASKEITISKFEVTGLLEFADKANIYGGDKEKALEKIIEKCDDFLRRVGNCNRENIVIVDDKVSSGIVLGKKYGITRVLFKHGYHADNPVVPDYTINSLQDLLKIKEIYEV